MDLPLKDMKSCNDSQKTPTLYNTKPKKAKAKKAKKAKAKKSKAKKSKAYCVR